MICFGNVPAGSVLPIMFGTYGKTNGESITLTGLAVTDIEIYKDTSMTQRASDAGYTLLDTDGIDIDGTTGIHGFSLDTGDNTDAGFFTAGSFYTVVVSSVTVDSQTVNFVAATFRLTVADNTSGTPVVDVGRISNDAIAADNAEAFFDGTGYAGTNNVIPTVTAVTGAVGSVTGNVGGNVAGSVGSVTGAVGSVTGLTASDVAAIKAKTDSLTFTKANEIDANIQSINGVTIVGDGAGTPFNV